MPVLCLLLHGMMYSCTLKAYTWVLILGGGGVWTCSSDESHIMVRVFLGAIHNVMVGGSSANSTVYSVHEELSSSQ